MQVNVYELLGLMRKSSLTLSSPKQLKRSNEQKGDMKEINIKLTTIQKKHLKTLLWLYDENINNRQTGRTTLIAYALIVSVLKDHRTRKIVDHLNLVIADVKILKPIIVRIIEENNLPLKVIHSTIELAYNEQQINI